MDQAMLPSKLSKKGHWGLQAIEVVLHITPGSHDLDSGISGESMSILQQAMQVGTAGSSLLGMLRLCLKTMWSLSVIIHNICKNSFEWYLNTLQIEVYMFASIIGIVKMEFPRRTVWASQWASSSQAAAAARPNA